MQALAADSLAADDATGWFERLYAAAAGDPARISWADLEPNSHLVGWLDRNPVAPAARVLVPGCGLGDDATLLATRGARVCAFDVSPTAVEWARRRHPRAPVEWRTADLLELPEEWRGAFALVAEVYTLQCLPPPERAQAIAQLAACVAPGGRLVAVGRLRDSADAPAGPPWPLTTTELESFTRHGLAAGDLLDTYDDEDPPVRRFVASYSAPLSA
jgi:SAM-dependent methyltransferase